jgi:hypothetical protein
VNKRHLRTWTLVVVVIYALAIGLGIILRILFPEDKQGHSGPWYGYGTYQGLLPFIIAIPAAWLSYCFQRRGSYLAALRSLWDDLIPAVYQAVQYTYLNKPDEQQYLATVKDLDIVIDSLRGVFQNIPSSDPIGLYPYENLKDIRGSYSLALLRQKLVGAPQIMGAAQHSTPLRLNAPSLIARV